MTAEDVCAYVLVAATQRTYEFSIALDLTVAQAAELMGRMVAAREGPRYRVDGSCDLMLVDGPTPGRLLVPQARIRSLVRGGELVDGQTLALV